MNNSVYVFKIKLGSLLAYMVILNVMMFSYALMRKRGIENYYWVILILNIIYLVRLIIIRTLVQIRIDPMDESISLNFWINLFQKSPTVYQIKNIECSYKEEMIARGIKRKVFRLLHNKKCIMKIESGSGWEQPVLEQIQNTIIQLKQNPIQA